MINFRRIITGLLLLFISNFLFSIFQSNLYLAMAYINESKIHKDNKCNQREHNTQWTKLY